MKKRKFKPGDVCYVEMAGEIMEGVISDETEEDLQGDFWADYTDKTHYPVAFDNILFPVLKTQVFRTIKEVQISILKREFDKVKAAAEAYNALALKFQEVELVRVTMDEIVVHEPITDQRQSRLYSLRGEYFGDDK